MTTPAQAMELLHQARPTPRSWILVWLGFISLFFVFSTLFDTLVMNRLFPSEPTSRPSALIGALMAGTFFVLAVRWRQNRMLEGVRTLRLGRVVKVRGKEVIVDLAGRTLCARVEVRRRQHLRPDDQVWVPDPLPDDGRTLLLLERAKGERPVVLWPRGRSSWT